MKSIQTISTNEEKSVKDLQALIAKKKKSLMRLVDKIEQLKIDIETLENEYDNRIGNLYKKDALLDLEIIRFKKINELMDQGYSFADAVMRLEESLQHEDVTYEDIKDYIDMPKEEALSKYLENDIKKIWKKLIHTYHPDLAQTQEDRAKREQVMKRINKAYAEKDFDVLMAIHDEEIFIEKEVTTLSQLEELFVSIQNAIVRSTNQLQDLRASKWYAWLRKSEEEKETLFSAMEKQIRDDVRTKEIFLRSLKRKHNNL